MLFIYTSCLLLATVINLIINRIILLVNRYDIALNLSRDSYVPYFEMELKNETKF